MQAAMTINHTCGEGFDDWRAKIASGLDSAEPLFTTDADGLFAEYLDALPEHERQYHTCHCCRRFVEEVGGLVRIDASGKTSSALWSLYDAPPLYSAAAERLARIVAKARVTGVWMSNHVVIGHPQTDEWTHFYARNPRVFRDRLRTPGQAMAEKRQDFGQVCRFLAETKASTIDVALRILGADQLYRSEKCLGVAEFLRDLYAARAATKNTRARENIAWRAIATAPAGFCHPKTSMIGTLLEDIDSGLAFDDVARRFAAKMHPLQYQRPQVAPAAANIRRAEEIVARLGIAQSLRRRYARLDEITTFWTPKNSSADEASGGVFGHLAPKGSATRRDMDLPPVTMTWAKFSSTVLPSAESLEYLLANHERGLCGMTTAANPQAPPILQWDSDGRRNPFAWYLYSGGSRAAQWGLSAGFRRVLALCEKPPHWYDAEANAHHGRGVLFVLVGARDSVNQSACLFPEILSGELREVRATIEAYSKTSKLEGEDDGAQRASGVLCERAQPWNATVAVTSRGVRSLYLIDRWD